MDWKNFFKPTPQKALAFAILAVVVLPSAYILLTGANGCARARGECSELMAFPTLLLSFWIIVVVSIALIPFYLTRPGTTMNILYVILFLLALAAGACLAYFLACALVHLLGKKAEKERKNKNSKK
jgi:drug/metabolite transporter (DMT)-like permease